MYISDNVLSLHVADIDECSSSPCENAGVCYDHVNAFSCACLAGYEGERCEIGTCLISIVTSVIAREMHVQKHEIVF
jgi:hypothetical protein